MKKIRTVKHFVVIATLLTVIILAGCEAEKKQEIEVDWMTETLSSLSEEQKIGQMFCLTVDPIRYFLYPDYKNIVDRLVSKYQPGALFLPANLDSVKMEIRTEFNGIKLNDELKKLQNLSKVPLLVSSDFQSGAWNWDAKATRFPFPLALGAAKSGEYAYRQGKITSVESISQGVNWIHSPLLNLSIDPLKISMLMNSYGDKGESVADISSLLITGSQEAGVASCMRYFPSVDNNSLMTLAPENIDENQMSVFRSAVNAGVMTVMTSPIDPDATPENAIPGNIKRLIKETLNNQLGYKGLVVSRFNSEFDEDTVVSEIDALIEAIDAGCTMFILPEIFDLDIPLIDMLHIETASGNINMTPVDSAVKTNIETKEALNLNLVNNRQAIRSMAGIGLPEYHQNSLDVARRSITVLKNEKNILPIDISDKIIVSISFIDDNLSHYAILYDELLDGISSKIRNITLFGTPDTRVQYEALRRAADADILICSFFIKPEEGQDNPGLSPEITDLMKRLSKINDNIIAVSYYDPFLVNQIPDVQSYVMSYSPALHSLESTLDVIFGVRDSYGRLPLTISAKYPVEHGLSIMGESND